MKYHVTFIPCQQSGSAKKPIGCKWRFFYAFLHPQKHIRLHTSKNITRTPAELWDIKNRRVPNTRLLLSLVGATMSKFAKYQTQANCHECHADLSHFVIKRVKRSNPTKGFCRLNPQFHQNKQKYRINCGIFVYLWSGRKDSNLRHLGPKPSTLPD